VLIAYFYHKKAPIKGLVPQCYLLAHKFSSVSANDDQGAVRGFLTYYTSWTDFTRFRVLAVATEGA
jgi:hypothetical protein